MSRNNKSQLNKDKMSEKETSLLKDIREQLIIQNIKDSHSMRERVPDVQRFQIKRNKVYTFSRKFRLGAVAASSVTGASGGYSFSLSQLPNASDFTNLFDQYRLAQITVTFAPNYVQANIPVYTCFDYDDASTPPSLLTLFEKETCRVSTSDQIIERSFTPRVLREVYATVATSGYETAIHPWIDSVNDTIPHYGFKYFIAPLPTSGLTNTYEVNVEFIVQGRNPT